MPLIKSKIARYHHLNIIAQAEVCLPRKIDRNFHNGYRPSLVPAKTGGRRLICGESGKAPRVEGVTCGLAPALGLLNSTPVLYAFGTPTTSASLPSLFPISFDEAAASSLLSFPFNVARLPIIWTTPSLSRVTLKSDQHDECQSTAMRQYHHPRTPFANTSTSCFVCRRRCSPS